MSKKGVCHAGFVSHHGSPSCSVPASSGASRPVAAGLRDASRAVHLGAAGVLLLYVYGPADLALALRPWLQLAVVPVVSLTGLLLWKQARIRRLLTVARRRGQRPPTTSQSLPER
ncbi:hypothetical protein [Streptomyces sp. NPDC050704]|uniref:hypothetical protein n=1 Tax=Streptomyces sp. NPDC050704 TaxID=3157219 RepID=UPI003426B875